MLYVIRPSSVFRGQTLVDGMPTMLLGGDINALGRHLHKPP